MRNSGEGSLAMTSRGSGKVASEDDDDSDVVVDGSDEVAEDSEEVDDDSDKGDDISDEVDKDSDEVDGIVEGVDDDSIKVCLASSFRQSGKSRSIPAFSCFSLADQMAASPAVSSGFPPLSRLRVNNPVPGNNSITISFGRIPRSFTKASVMFRLVMMKRPRKPR